MKIVRYVAAVIIVSLTALSPTIAQTQKPKRDPCKNAMTQLEMNRCASMDLRRTELKLEKLLKQYGISPNSPEQKSWEAYRDAQLAALYPSADNSEYGSAYPMCLATLKKALTEGRIRDLEGLRNSREGDVCTGYRDAVR